MCYDTEFIRNVVFNLVDFSYSGKIIIEDYNGISVRYENQTAVIGCKDKTTLARGFFLLAKELSKGNHRFNIAEHPCFDDCGVMIDTSRNGVMKVQSVKKFMEYMAALGLNTLMLYMEDTFELEGYPHFGYLRGRYSLNELREIDDYAYSLGIEVIPCIQTLGHMSQYLKWNEAGEIRDTPVILLVDEPETYIFIEKMIKTVRAAFRTNRIHIGMDEAHDMGLGNYLKKHGFEDRFALFNRHLKRVYDISKKYYEKTMIWSDMYFRLGSKTGSYYDVGSVIPQNIIDDIPDVQMVYWDYEHNDYSYYEKMISKHLELRKDIIFAGGIWTWDGFIENTDFTLETMVPALKACINNNIKTVVATMWGDDGCETNIMHSVHTLPLFSEYCYKGAGCKLSDIYEASEYLTKMEMSKKLAVSRFNLGFKGYTKAGKKLVFNDILLNMFDVKIDYDKALSLYRNTVETLEESMIKHDRWHDYYEYCCLLFKIALVKCELFRDLRRKYLSRDMEYLKNLAQNVLPQLLDNFIKLNRCHQKQWEETYKIFGFEVINLRYGATMERIRYAIDRISRFIRGEIPDICELEEEIILEDEMRCMKYRDIVTPSSIY